MGTLSVRGDVLVVPPFECAWLKLDKPGEGCFTFLAKAENDVTLIFSSNAEGKRVCGTRRNSEFYTVIIGSHVNSRLVLERSGKIVHEVAGVRASPTKFTQVSLSSATQNPHAPLLVPSPALADPQLALPLSVLGGLSDGKGLGRGGCEAWFQLSLTMARPRTIYVHRLPRPQRVGQARVLQRFKVDGKAVLRPSVQEGERGVAGKSPSPCSLSFSFSLLTSVSFSQQPRAGQVASLQMLSAWRLSECLTPANCLSVLAVAEDLRATPLVRTTLDYLSSHLVEVVGASGHELFSLSTRSLADVLSRDKLSLVSEYWAFSSVLLTWQGQGGGAAEDLWEFIRWPLMSSSELERVEALPCYAGSARLRRLVAEARRTHSTKGDPKKTRRYQNVLITAARGMELRGQESAKLARSRLQPRRSPSARELLYVSDGDNNGVCFYLGTRRGEASSSRFVCPALPLPHLDFSLTARPTYSLFFLAAGPAASS